MGSGRPGSPAGRHDETQLASHFGDVSDAGSATQLHVSIALSHRVPFGQRSWTGYSRMLIRLPSSAEFSHTINEPNCSLSMV